MIRALTNHLWQSTLFALAMGLLTLAFRRNRAAVRYWIWFAASMKFLAPFALLMTLGSSVPAPKLQRAVAPAVPAVVEEIAIPWAPAPAVRETVDWLPSILFTLWACGLVAVAAVRLRGWMRIRAAVRASAPLDIPAAIEIRSAPGMLEPGVVGFFRPTLLLPVGIADRLTPPQLEAVLAHEMCHVRRRDNLLSAIHMVVEALFWFHPPVWWIGARLVEERERACDEAVLGLGSQAREYAQAILNVCKLYAESPLACVSGVTGADLKKRVAAILRNRAILRLSVVQKAALTVVGSVAIAAPVVMGLAHAQSTAAPVPKFEVASIKPCQPGEAAAGRGASGVGPSPDRLDIACQSVAGLIQLAYGRRGGPAVVLAGAPAWINAERYRIDAKAEGPESRQALEGPMLQGLLEERFQLKTHRESRDAAVYLMTVAKGGPKFQPSADGACVSDPEKRRAAIAAGEEPVLCGIFFGRKKETPGILSVSTRGISMDGFAEDLSHVMDRPVMNKTGLTGVFDLRAEFLPDDVTPAFRPGGERATFAAPPEGTASDPGPSLVEALRQQVGLQLEPGKGSREFLVIDRVERPKEN